MFPTKLKPGRFIRSQLSLNVFQTYSKMTFNSESVTKLTFSAKECPKNSAERSAHSRFNESSGGSEMDGRVK
jgi:hypothetical protein